MVLHRLLSMLLNNPRLIQSLSETRPIRAAARFTAYLFLRAKDAIEDQARRPKIVNQGTRAASGFAGRFKSELRKGWEEAKRDQARGRRQ